MNRILIIFCFFISFFASAQQTKYVDFTKGIVRIKIEPEVSKVSGSVIYDFEILRSTDSIYVDAKNMIIKDVLLGNESVNFKYKDNKVVVHMKFETSVKNTIVIFYEAQPKKAMYFVERDGEAQVWTQGQGKYTSNWLPSFDDVNEKIIFDFNISVPGDLKVLANGKFLGESINGDYSNWIYSMKKPMSSYLVALAIGTYDVKKETSKSGIPLEYYYYPEDSLKVEPTYRYTKQMFDFLEAEIDFAYPWQNYKQVPVHDFLYSGMENTSLTIFSDAFVVDSIGFNDRNYVNVNAHELAHQWFGDLVTATSGKHHWLQEGFATYYALLAEKEVFGRDYFDFKLYNSAQELTRQDVAGNGTSLLNPKSSSLTFYQRGAWVLYALRDKVGDTIFKNAVRNYLKTHQFANVNTKDFMSEVERLYGESLSEFVETWILNKEFPFNEAIELLKSNSVFIQEYVMIDCEANSSKCEDYLKYYVSDEAKIKVIAQRPDLVSNKTFQERLKVRQAISQYVTKIPPELKDNYETLLDDKSYVTVESALYNLWLNFPSERSRYLVETKGIHGFYDKNVRLLWLVLNLNTPEFQSDKKQELLDELKSYSNPGNNFQRRINAFNYLDLIGACGTACKDNLKNAKTHHNWRMVKFAKDMLDKQNKK